MVDIRNKWYAGELCTINRNMFENDKGTHQRTRCKVLWGSAKKRLDLTGEISRGVGWGGSGAVCASWSPGWVYDVWRDIQVQVSENIQNLRDEVFCTPSFLPWDDAKAFPVYPFFVSWVCPRVFSHWMMPRTFYTGVILVRYPNYFNWFLSMMRISGPPLCPSQSSSSHPRGWAQTPLGRISFLLLLSTTSFFLSPLKVCGHFPVDWLCSSISCFTHREVTLTLPSFHLRTMPSDFEALIFIQSAPTSAATWRSQ